MGNSNSHNYTENLAMIRERLAGLEERMEDLGTIKADLKALHEKHEGAQALARDVSINRWLLKLGLPGVLALAAVLGKVL